jgi:DNA-binding MarR family transcriptional regulator/GNAT superfamily N-acetyltransferase
MEKHLSDYGLLALGSLLKKVSDRLLKDVDDIYQALGSSLSARLVPCLMLIKDNGQLSVSELADKLGQTHSAVSQMSRKLLAQELIFDAPDPKDERRRMLSLTPKGYESLDRLDKCLTHIQQQLRLVLDSEDERLIQMLTLLDRSLQQQPLSYRVLSVIQDGACDKVQIVAYRPQYAAAFKQLNVEWLEKYFYVEAIDEEILSHPDDYIIQPGGQIFMALIDEQPVGTAALIAVGDDSFELSKMSVTPNLQGKGIGRRLVNRAIRYFQESGRSRLYLESNSKLKPALKLYESVGFVHKPKPDSESHYQRADVYMEYQG